MGQLTLADRIAEQDTKHYTFDSFVEWIDAFQLSKRQRAALTTGFGRGCLWQPRPADGPLSEYRCNHPNHSVDAHWTLALDAALRYPLLERFWLCGYMLVGDDYVLSAKSSALWTASKARKVFNQWFGSAHHRSRRIKTKPENVGHAGAWGVVADWDGELFDTWGCCTWGDWDDTLIEAFRAWPDACTFTVMVLYRDFETNGDVPSPDEREWYTFSRKDVEGML